MPSTIKTIMKASTRKTAHIEKIRLHKELSVDSDCCSRITGQVRRFLRLFEPVQICSTPDQLQFLQL